MRAVTIRELLNERQRDFHLEVLAGDGRLDRGITTGDISRPGLALSGYMGYYLWERVQIIGITETGYLETLAPDQRREAVNCITVTKGLPVQPDLVSIAAERGIPVLRTDIDTTDFIHRFSSYVDNKLAPTTSVHGALVDVYGVGLLFTGESGIGKS